MREGGAREHRDAAQQPEHAECGASDAREEVERVQILLPRTDLIGFA